MRAICVELDEAMKNLDATNAKRLEKLVRARIVSALQEQLDKVPSLEELRKMRPDLAGFIGCLADEEFEIAPELPLPPAKVW